MEYSMSIIHDLCMAKDTSGILEIVFLAVRQIVGEDATCVFFGGEVHCFGARDNADFIGWQNQALLWKPFMKDWALTQTQPFLASDVLCDKRVPPALSRISLVRGLALVPVQSFSNFGLLAVFCAQIHEMNELEIHSLKVLADSAAMAMKNLQLGKELEEKNRALEQVNQLKNDFLQILSHELRTPLNAIQGWAHLLAEGRLQADEFKIGIQTIERNAADQLYAVECLLDSASIFAGKLILDKKLHDFLSIVESSIELMREQAAAKSIALNLRFGLVPIGALLLDIVRIQQIVQHLLSNAIKFTPKGGHVEITVDRREGSVCLGVHDSGIGIAAECIPSLFHRFSLVDSSRTRSQGGLGLGLFLVRSLLDAHGGTVQASSQGSGQGSSFEVYLPTQSFAVAPKKESQGLPKEMILEGVRILAVDDAPDVRLLVTAVLRRFGAKVLAVAGAKVAMAALETSIQDILICDLSMPEEDGFSLIRRIRAKSLYSHARLPAIALTAFADREHENLALIAGFDGFIGKPVHPSKLVALVASFLSSQAVFRGQGIAGHFDRDSESFGAAL